ncbi:hypothetical protein [Bifidobacterium vespertilionis]|uniref:Uncharacterized protein n=1 Tax=Bifidobacterium vespertilionis TaxID=2562524 RepID=A0A5J5E063_9BIFI|nr:hypothetical protein [Bifidobacterium vespertilionis]KAA8822495.1 hypothetical protein EMO90_00410 [Bifidobacterium vespertilionis]KAA8824443.1 hypothetical protein EM848_01115 [Bifidobacterium vespertilionis]
MSRFIALGDDLSPDDLSPPDIRSAHFAFGNVQNEQIQCGTTQFHPGKHPIRSFCHPKRTE